MHILLNNYSILLAMKVLFATCFDPEILSELQRNDGKLISVKPSTTDISYR
jgi:alpha-glucan, water dikinase